MKEEGVHPSALRLPLFAFILALSLSAASAHIGPGAHENLSYAGAPGLQKIPAGGYWSLEFAPSPGAEMVLGLAKATEQAEVDLLLMNRTEFGAYRAAVEQGGGPLSYDHSKSVLLVSRRDAFWTAEGPGPYVLVVDNTRLPVGGGRGRVDAEVYVALGSDQPLRSPPPAAGAGPAPLPAMVVGAAAAGGVAVWILVRRRLRSPARGRGRE